jgi:ABC-type multidrug transport system fused ATPase/permease subunit
LILVIENGSLVGSGTHEELLKSNELYQKLARLQLFR